MSPLTTNPHIQTSHNDNKTTHTTRFIKPYLIPLHLHFSHPDDHSLNLYIFLDPYLDLAF